MKRISLIFMTVFLMACGSDKTSDKIENKNFNYIADRFADIEILHYKVPDFDSLKLNQKIMIYYLNQAALEGRDILYDQNFKHNLSIRRTLESIYQNYKGDRNSEDFKAFTVYLKQVWMGNGIHHHYSGDKFVPAFSSSFFQQAINDIEDSKLPLSDNETKENLISKLSQIIFDPSIAAKRINQAPGVDLIQTSSNNYYEGVTQAEVENFYAKMKDPNDKTPISYGLNSKVTKKDGEITELTYKLGGMYSPAIEKIIYWLNKAAEYSENNKQKDIINTLIEYYKNGDLKTFDEYCIKWVQDSDSQIDFVNGFTESYGDPLGMKASWESIVNFKNIEATKRTEIISKNAQWFEDNSPISKEFKKEEVKGVSAKVITATILGGDCYPATPIGINLPNSNWIRLEYGSKSVTIENITEAYNKASMGSGFNEEFMWSSEEIERAKKYSDLTSNLHIDLHECLGHGSGKLLPGTDPDALKAYGSSIEEARADLFSLYYMGDNKMVELGLMPDNEAYKTQYYSYIMNGYMTQLTRIEPGKNVEQAHMRNRKLISAWVIKHGENENIIELKKKDNKTYVVINDYEKLRTLFGKLLAEIQEIKSTGNFEKAKNLIETYAVKVDPDLHAEILERYKKLNIAPYRGFVNPVYTEVKNQEGIITDISVSFEENYIEQHLRYSKEYSSLPTYN